METQSGDLVYFINGKRLNFILVGDHIWVFAYNGKIKIPLISDLFNFTLKDIAQILYSCGGRKIQNLIVFYSKEDIEVAVMTLKLIKN